MKPITSNITKNIQNHLKENKPFVFYRKSNKAKVTSLVQKDNTLHTTTGFNESGFLMMPFDKSKNAILFPSDKLRKESFAFSIKKIKRKTSSINEDLEVKPVYLKLLNRTIDFINENKADKIVISRKIRRDYDKEQIGSIFENLLHEYKKSFVYIWFHPKVGLWMGATPEKLVSVNDDTFETMALAGTQLFKDKIDWGLKEQEEQKWVTDFITDQLIPISDNLEISSPYTAIAGHLAHIRTDISGQLTDETSLQDLIKRLHPTPAVCGTPRNVAKGFIIENEAYDRDFYTGFLGELNLNNQTDLFVNLRCMQLHDSHATLYVGGGITKDSIPEEEWKETENKAKVLGRFLN